MTKQYSRVINVENMEFKKDEIIKINKNESWSGEDSKESFTNEWNKGITVVFFLKLDNGLMKKLTLKDICTSEEAEIMTEEEIRDNIDFLDFDEDDYNTNDVIKFDEYRTTKEFKTKITDISSNYDYEEMGFYQVILEKI